VIQLPLAGGIAVFLVLAILLLSLNIASLWRWWIKAGAIVVTLAGIVVLYFVFTGVIGWPSAGTMPARFSLLATRIVEPDKMTGAPGHIYLWIEEVDDRQIVVSPPRAFEVPYKIETATDVATAQQKIEGGGKVLGEFAADSNEQATAAQTAQEKGSGQVDVGPTNDGPSNAGGEGAQSIGDTGALSFSDMPPVDLPDKAVMQVQ
jgi:hypothetical protein